MSALLRRTTSKHHCDFFCLNCLHFFATEKKPGENKDFCNFVISFEEIKILKFSQYQKSDKAPFVIYDNLGGCKIDPENSFTKKSRRTYSGRFFRVYNIII